MRRRNRLAVHRVGDDRPGIGGLGQRHLADERRLRAHRPVGARGPDVSHAGTCAHPLQQVGEPHAGPRAGAHRPLAPLDAGHRRVEEGAAVAGAFERDGHRGRRHLAQLGQRQRRRRGRFAVDGQPPRRLVERRRHRHVAADVERVERREEAVEQRRRRLEVGRPHRARDQPRVLAGQPLGAGGKGPRGRGGRADAELRGEGEQPAAREREIGEARGHPGIMNPSRQRVGLSRVCAPAAQRDQGRRADSCRPRPAAASGTRRCSRRRR